MGQTFEIIRDESCLRAFILCIRERDDVTRSDEQLEYSRAQSWSMGLARTTKWGSRNVALVHGITKDISSELWVVEDGCCECPIHTTETVNPPRALQSGSYTRVLIIQALIAASTMAQKA